MHSRALALHEARAAAGCSAAAWARPGRNVVHSSALQRSIACCNGACRCNASSVLQPARFADARRCNSAVHHVSVAVPTGATRCGTLCRGGAPVVVRITASGEKRTRQRIHPQHYSMCTTVQRRPCLPIGRRVFRADATQFGDRHCGHAVRGEEARRLRASWEARRQRVDTSGRCRGGGGGGTERAETSRPLLISLSFSLGFLGVSWKFCFHVVFWRGFFP